MYKTRPFSRLAEFANSGLLIAFAGAGVAASTAFINLNFINVGPAVLCVFLTIYSVYRINKILDFQEDSLNTPTRLKYISDRKRITYADWFWPVLLYLSSFVIAFVYSYPAFLICVFSFFWIVIYSAKLPFSVFGYWRIKQIPVVKTVYGAIAWAVLPIIASFFATPLLPMSTIIFSLFTFTRLCVNMIIFDLRDLNGDKKNKIITIPQILGQKKTVSLLSYLNLFSGVLLVAAVLFGSMPSFSIFLALAVMYGFFFISKIGVWNIDFLCDVIIDGELVLWPLFLSFGYFLFYSFKL